VPITVGAWSCASNWPCWAPAQSRLSRLSGAPSGAVSARGHSRSTSVGLLPVQNWLRRPRDHGLHQWSASVNWWATDYSAPDSAAQYCDERVRLSVCLCVGLCVFVCPRSYLRTYTSDLHQFVLCMLPMAAARSSSGGVVICYVLPVLWMTSYLLISQGCSTSPQCSVFEKTCAKTQKNVKSHVF